MLPPESKTCYFYEQQLMMLHLCEDNYAAAEFGECGRLTQCAEAWRLARQTFVMKICLCMMLMIHSFSSSSWSKVQKGSPCGGDPCPAILGEHRSRWKSSCMGLVCRMSLWLYKGAGAMGECKRSPAHTALPEYMQGRPLCGDCVSLDPS